AVRASATAGASGGMPYACSISPAAILPSSGRYWGAPSCGARTRRSSRRSFPPAPVMRRCVTSNATIEKIAMLSVPEVSRRLTIDRDELAGLVNVVGGIQPEVAGEVFGAGPDDGFAARFTSVWPETTADWRHVDRAPNK